AYTDKEYLLSLIDLHIEQYIVKPVNFKELSNALQKCLEVISGNHAIAKDLLCGYRYDFDNKTLASKEEKIKLSKKEIAFFELLIQNKHRVVTYEELQKYIWKDDIMSNEALKSLVRNIRHKLSKDCIKNLSGIGYKLVES
ncbi:MAG: DNA-binding response regulator, partial [Sulfurospirillum sp.]